MFRTKEEIRRATRAKIWARGYAEGRAEARKGFLNRLTEAVRRFGILDETTGVMMLPLTPEVEDFLHSDAQRGQPIAPRHAKNSSTGLSRRYDALAYLTRQPA